MATTTIEDIMTRRVATVHSDTTLQHAAQQMSTLNIGAMPVCDGDALVGIVTDRDIAVRGVAAGRSPIDTRVADVMTRNVHCCAETDSVDAAMAQMGEAQVRRLAVLGADRKLTGIVALGDLATRQQSSPTDAALREISERSTAP